MTRRNITIHQIVLLSLLTHLSIATNAQIPASSQSVSPSTDPTLHAKLNLPEPKNPALPTLYLVGDSTVRNGHGDGANGQWGWGEPLVDYFNTTKINVVNRAIGGRSSRTYITEGHWQEVLDRLKPGDFILLQFGHNDSGSLDDTSRARGTLPGTDSESREIENPILKRHEVVHTYGWYIREYVQQARNKGAIIIVCSLIPRKIWENGRVVRSGSDSYGGWASEIAHQENVPFINLNEIIAREYDAMGESAVEPLFADPHTHTSLKGAKINAEAVITGLKLLHPDPLGSYFSSQAKAVPAAMPSLQP